MSENRIEKIKKLLALMAIVIVILFIGYAVSIVSFNQKDYVVKGADDRKESYLQIAERGDSTSKWVKRDYDLNGEKVDISAQTFDGVFHNNAKHDITEWKMVINIKDDCFINNTWCGTMEIHQHKGKDNEKVQTLDLRDYDINEVKLDYLYDGDLLIPLEKGDYLVYYPSEKDDEIPVKASTDLTMGMIFYYTENIDLSDYRVEFRYHENFREGRGFYALLALALLWLVSFTGIAAADLSYKKAWKELEIRRSGISYMADIYEGIYIIDIKDDEITELHSADEHSSGERKIINKEHAAKQLRDMFATDVAEAYSGIMRDFVDLSTLDERLRKGSIACEYISKSRGWCQARFIAMERFEGEALSRVIFTNQIINDEKLEMERIEESLTRREPLGILEPEVVRYDFTSMIRSICDGAAADAEAGGVTLEEDISPKIPAELTGCESIIRRAAAYMLAKSIGYSKGGSVKLSVFCKPSDGSAHLLVSVKGSSGAGEDRAAEFELVDGLLELAGSKLEVIDEDGSREMYFEIDQKTADNGESED